MKIVILDGHVLNPGDLSWDGFRALGEITVYERTAPEESVARIGDAPYVITNKVLITREVMDACPTLRYVGVLATGYNVVDIAEANRRGIVVTNIPAYSTPSVAQMAIALLLEVCLHVGAHSQSVHAGDWTACRDFSYWHYPLIELSGKTMGIIGFGSTGQATARVAQALGMRILVHTRTQHPELLTGDMRFATLEELLSQSDVVSLHCPLTDATQHLICEKSLAHIKRGAIVINTGRGPLVDDGAVRRALEDGTLSAYAADVLTVEPPREGNPLLGAPNCILTPHIAWAPLESRTRLMNTAVSNLRAYLEGTPQNVVAGL